MPEYLAADVRAKIVVISDKSLSDKIPVSSIFLDNLSLLEHSTLWETKVLVVVD